MFLSKYLAKETSFLLLPFLQVAGLKSEIAALILWRSLTRRKFGPQPSNTPTLVDFHSVSTSFDFFSSVFVFCTCVVVNYYVSILGYYN